MPDINKNNKQGAKSRKSIFGFRREKEVREVMSIGDIALDFRQQAEAIQLPTDKILLIADKVAATVAQGAHGRRRAGMGESFWQYRHFNYEDGRSAIDWRRSARSDSLYVRETEWEAAQSLWIYRDQSASMAYRSRKQGISKSDRADVIAIALAKLVLNGGEKLGLINHGGKRNLYHGKKSHSRFTMELLAPRLMDDQSNTNANSQADLSSILMDMPKYSHLLFISDFLDPLPHYEALFRHMAERHLKVTFLAISDPAEETLPFRGRIKFSGFKQELPVLIRKAQTIREDYKNKRRLHFQSLSDIARHMGWQWISHNTKHSPEPCLMALYQATEGKFSGHSQHNKHRSP
ncbi:MAG: DUF58 domain-containing protein [Alphaproteobacteria bacterium]|nr:DUF58 domain-containing protein [Alphaproteobacteria bacterium]